MPLTAAEREERIAQYERGPLRIRNALAVVPDNALKWRPAPGRWSVHEVVCHCADSRPAPTRASASSSPRRTP
jgi:hypothetical protein